MKKRSAADKAPALKAPKTISKSPAPAAAKAKSAKATKAAPVRKAAAKAAPKAAPAKSKAVSKAAPAKTKSAAKTPARKPVAVKAAQKRATPPSKTAKAAPAKVAPTKAAPTQTAKSAKAPAKQGAKTAPPRKSAAPLTHTPSRQPTQDEAAALRAFERAHKEFVRGHFGEARQLFRALVEKHAGVSEVTARARTYLTIAEARLRSEPQLPRDADSLYDRGVIELNRGDYVAAQELFERALKREHSAAHIHYGLAATRARLGSIDSALESLQHALEIQPSLRIRAQHDPDLTPLRNDPEFERLVFAPRF
ncbi:MAG TPA: tetratricopeptide repeat protein [Pyrinomonadaceae bacterium]